MNNYIITPDNSQSGLITLYTILPPMSKGSAPLGAAYKPCSSWRKFVHASTQQSGCESTMTVVPAAKTTSEGPTVLKPALLPEDYDARAKSFRHFLDSLEAEADTTDDITAEQ